MASKGRRLDNRTVLIILLLLVIIGAGYLIITNLPAEIDYKTPDEIVRNMDGFLGQKIIIKGYYDKDAADQSVIVSTMSTGEGRAELKLDYSNILNATDDLRAGTLYYFTGRLTKITEIEGVPIPVPIYIFVAEKFEEV